MITFEDIEKSQEDPIFQKFSKQLKIIVDGEEIGKTLWIPEIILYQLNKRLYKKFVDEDNFFISIDSQYESLTGFYDFLKDVLDGNYNPKCGVDPSRFFASLHFDEQFYKIELSIRHLLKYQHKLPEVYRLNAWEYAVKNESISTIQQYFKVPVEIRKMCKPLDYLFHEMTVEEIQKEELKTFLDIYCGSERDLPFITLDNGLKLCFKHGNIVKFSYRSSYIECKHENKQEYKLCKECYNIAMKNSMFFIPVKGEKPIKILDGYEYTIKGNEKIKFIKDNTFIIV